VTYHGRFAPSPTGPLHFGSLVAAIASWLDARSARGRWTLRIEDVDTPRVVAGAEEAILGGLAACGLEWDGPVTRQSERFALYGAALERLRAQGFVYRCACSRREIADSALRGIEGAVYPGTCRKLALDAAQAAAERFVVPEGIVAFDDRLQGHVEQDVARAVGDFVLRRRDRLYGYQLAVVVDDADQGISDVVRGADLLASTPRQILLQRALGLGTPRYLHFPVVLDARGHKLSKQTDAPPLEGTHAAAQVRAALAFLGQQPIEGAGAPETLAAAVANWDLARVPRATGMPA